MPKVTISHALYGLLLATVLFVSCFLLFIQILPPELYNPYKNYHSGSIPTDISSGDFSIFSYEKNFTLTPSIFKQSFDFNGTTTDWYYTPSILASPYTGEPNSTYFIVYRVHYDLWIFRNLEAFQSAEKTPFDVHVVGTGIASTPATGFSNLWIMQFYNNQTDTATFSIKSSTLTLRITMSSNSSSYTLPQALSSNAPIRVFSNWSYDFSAMGLNIWTLIGTILTFQTIATGVSILDAVLNSLISLPIWTAIVYLAYRFIAGIIPFASGGGGQ